MTDYTGDVTPGGPADVRELDQLTIAKLAVDEKMANNAYLLTCRATGEKLLIDAADDAPELLSLVNGSLSAVVTTHQHWDPHPAPADVVAATAAPVHSRPPSAAAPTPPTH